MKALIFDLDGVVADTTGAHYRSWKRLADEEKIPFDENRYEALLGRTREDSLGLLLAGHAVSDSQRIALLARKQAYFALELAKMGPGDALPGVVPLLDEGHSAGLKLALASSSRNARAVLQQLGLADRFEVIADGNSVEKAKPAPDIFIWTASMLHIDPLDCIVIEDSAAGITAALAAGCRVVSVGPKRHADTHFVSLMNVGLSALGNCEG